MAELPECLCGARHYEVMAEFAEPPQGEVRFQLEKGRQYFRQLVRCKSCGHVRSIHDMDMSQLYTGNYVDSTYGADGLRRAFERIVGLDPSKSDNVGRVERLLQFASGHLSSAAAPPSILDIGSGLCVFLHRVKTRAGWDCTALDPDPRAAQHARDTVGVRAVCGDFTKDIELGTYDVITFNKVLEHVLDPVSMLARSDRFLREGGFVYIELPDVAAAAESPAREEFFIDHHHVFTPESLRALARRAGFVVLELEQLREPSSKYTLRAFLGRARPDKATNAEHQPNMTVRPSFSAPATDSTVHSDMYEWARDLFPLCRSITGAGVRDTLEYFRRFLPELRSVEVPTGTVCFDWTVPDEWTIRDAWLVGPDGERVADFKVNNLHVVSYSLPVDVELELEELEPHLYSLPDQPDAIPYVTSYYTRRWGFCIPHNKRKALKKGRYRAFIDSTLAPGALTYGELLLPGRESREVLLSSYVCHPSMANDNLSGPVVTAALARWLRALPDRRYTYRIVFVPETIGSIVYLSRNLEAMRRNTVAGFVLTCCGDERGFGYLSSPWEDTLADRATRHVLRHSCKDFVTTGFIDRGSDERQYCAPGVDLPVVSVMRSRYDTFPEYHTSLDDLSVISPAGLGGTYEVMQKVLTALEHNYRFGMKVLCEPQLGRRGLYPTLNTKMLSYSIRNILNFGAYADGKRDLIEIADRIGLSVLDCLPLAKSLYEADLLSIVEETRT
jgi:aminopeptidase-like protein/SAM-dependent methyltransferase